MWNKSPMRTAALTSDNKKCPEKCSEGEFCFSPPGYKVTLDIYQQKNLSGHDETWTPSQRGHYGAGTSTGQDRRCLSLTGVCTLVFSSKWEPEYLRTCLNEGAISSTADSLPSSDCPSEEEWSGVKETRITLSVTSSPLMTSLPCRCVPGAPASCQSGAEMCISHTQGGRRQTHDSRNKIMNAITADSYSVSLDNTDC